MSHIPSHLRCATGRLNICKETEGDENIAADSAFADVNGIIRLSNENVVKLPHYLADAKTMGKEASKEEKGRSGLTLMAAVWRNPYV